MTEIVFVAASGIIDFGGGLFGIQLPVRELSPSEARLLQELFPNTGRAVQALLTREALLSAIVQDPVIPGKDEPAPAPRSKAKQPRANRESPEESSREGEGKMF